MTSRDFGRFFTPLSSHVVTKSQTPLKYDVTILRLPPPPEKHSIKLQLKHNKNNFVETLLK